MLAAKRGASAFSRASSSKVITLTSSSLRGCRFYADDGERSRKEVYEKLLSASSSDQDTLDDILSPAGPRAPNQPPRFSNVKLPASNRIRPAPPVGGPQAARFQLPARTAHPTTNEDHTDVTNLVNMGNNGIRDVADQKAAEIFGTGEQREGGNQQYYNGRGPIITTNITYRLYVTARMKNCIMTLVNENNIPLAVVSSGRCGFRNVAEGTYEAGYQCAIRMFDILREKKELRKEGIQLEIFLNGFGQGRSALLKALTMSEGEGVRQLVVNLRDNTPIKIGGVRLQKSRRL